MADAEITARQLRLIIEILCRNAAELLSKGHHALKTGEESTEEKTSASGTDGVTPDLVELFVRFRAIAQTAESRAALITLQSQFEILFSVRIMV